MNARGWGTGAVDDRAMDGQATNALPAQPPTAAGANAGRLDRVVMRPGANIKALQNMLGHESAGLTLDRYGHLYGSDVEAVGVAINDLLTQKCGQSVGTGGNPTPKLRAVNSA
jgi:hypothetical protein